MIKNRPFTLFSHLLLPLVAFAATTVSAGQKIPVPSDNARTISQALIKARPGDTLIVENGVYREHLYVKEGIGIKAKNRGKVRINGMGRGTAITMGTNSCIDGIEVFNSTIGIFSRNPGVVIRNCLVYKNWMTGLMAVRHLPKIEDNVVAFNRSSGIQLWDVRSTNSSINHNTIAYNSNNGLAVGGTSTVVVENNCIAFNERFGFKFSESSNEKSTITHNNFWQNGIRGPLLKDNHSFDPAFMSARGGLDFRPDPKECCSVKGTDNELLGARFSF